MTLPPRWELLFSTIGLVLIFLFLLYGLPFLFGDILPLEQ